MPQLSYSQDAIIAQPGMPMDGDMFEQGRVSRVCSQIVPFGTLCETDVNGYAVPLQAATTLAGTVTVTAASAAITFTTAQTLPQGQALVFSDQPGVVYYLAAAIAAGTAGTLTQNYSGAGGAAKLASLAPYFPNLLGIAVLNPMAEEEDYVPWSLPVALAGTVTLTNASTALTFSVAQTLAAGQQIVFSDQPGKIYFISAATVASTTAVLTSNYLGTGGAGKTSTVQNGAGQCKGFRAGRVGSFMRQGRIWALGDGAGTVKQYGSINVRHSSTGANAQGVFTFGALSQVVGAEVDVAPGCLIYQPPGQGSAGAPQSVTDPFGNTFFIYPVEINV